MWKEIGLTGTESCFQHARNMAYTILLSYIAVTFGLNSNLMSFKFNLLILETRLSLELDKSIILF